MKIYRREFQLGPIGALGILIVILLIFSIVLYKIGYKQTGNNYILYGIIALGILILVLLASTIRIYFDQRMISKEFFPLEERRGQENVLQLADKLATRLEGTDYFIQTNEDGLRIIRDIMEYENEFLNFGEIINVPGITILKTSSPNKFKEIRTDFSFKKDGDNLYITPIYLGGKSIKFVSGAQIKKKDDGIEINHSPFQDVDLLSKIIRESKKEDGWKAGLDTVSAIGIFMAILGLLIAIGIGFILRIPATR